MATAVLKLVKLTGAAPGTPNDALDGRAGLLSADVHGNAADYPIAVPRLQSDPDEYSYECKIVLELTSAPDNQVNNFKIWGQPSQPNNDPAVTDYLGTEAVYTQPTSAQSSIATAAIHTTHYDEATALSIGGTLVNIGDRTNPIVYQRKVEFGAQKGTVPVHSQLYRYDES